MVRLLTLVSGGQSVRAHIGGIFPPCFAGSGRRSAEGKFERFGEIAADLIRHGIDVIVVTNILVAKQVIRVTNTVPIVMAAISDPVGAGVVTSLARPVVVRDHGSAMGKEIGCVSRCDS